MVDNTAKELPLNGREEVEKVQKEKSGESYRQYVMLSVDAYEKGNPVGRLYSLSQEQEETYDSLLRCLQKVEQVLEGEEFPETAGQNGLPGMRRTWKGGQLATLEIRVLFRQRDSWQGILTWVEGRQQKSFGSVWDLIQKMDRILSGKSLD